MMRPPTTVHDIPDQLLHNIVHCLHCHISIIRAAAMCKRWRRIGSARNMDPFPDKDRHQFFTCISHYHVVEPSLISSSGSQRCRHVFIPIIGRHDTTQETMNTPDPPEDRRGSDHEENMSSSVPMLENAQLSPGLVSQLVPTNKTIEVVPGRSASWDVARTGVVVTEVQRPRTKLQNNITHPKPVPEALRQDPPDHGDEVFPLPGVFLGCRYNVISMCSFKVTRVLYDQAAGMEDDVNIVTTHIYNHRMPPYPTLRVKYGWDMSREAIQKSIIHLRGAESADFAGHARGIKFWGIKEDGTVLSIEENTGKFSHFHLPDHVRGESRDKSTFWFVDEWLHEKIVCLPEATRGLPGHKERYFSCTGKIVAAGKGYAVLMPAEETWLLKSLKGPSPSAAFSVEVRTMKLYHELKQVRDRLAGEVYPYELRIRPKVNSCMAD
ncbi:hypothetical protein PR202_ga16147 [Eleusine coracana subsp. coracana]|uniref:F-box domain-containing protein n=1 Tax=Eleusine coracana subsp. coracana TaxID=191504 RepID=A0AAV5CME9_ELECO|nr:hypothetical protein PR202_ga16147 [Eleusine coracana subsp. coracana]